MPSPQGAQTDSSLATLRHSARCQGYRAALTQALTTSQAPGSRAHIDAWHWLIGADAGLLRACREAIAWERTDLLAQWAAPLNMLIPDRRESRRFYQARLRAILSCAQAVGCLLQDTEPTGALGLLGEAHGAWTGTISQGPVVPLPWPDTPSARLLHGLRALQTTSPEPVGSLWDLGMFFLTGQWPLERASRQLWVVFVLEEVGVLALLTLRQHASGLSGLSQDPRTLAFALFEATFAQTLRDAWEAFHPSAPDIPQGHVVWGLDGPPFWLERPLAGPSLSGALKVGLYGLGHAEVPRTILHTVISAAGDPQDPERLAPVGGLADLRPKLQSCQKAGLTLMTSPEEVRHESDWGHQPPRHLVTAATVSDAVAYLTTPTTEGNPGRSWRLVQYYPYSAEHCFQVLSTRVLPRLSFRYSKGYHWSKVRLPIGRVVLKVFDAHPPTWRLDVRLRLRVLGVLTALAPGIHRDGPQLILYCKAVDRDGCMVHCEVPTVALTKSRLHNMLRMLTVRYHPARAMFRRFPLMINRFFDDACAYDLQQMIEAPEVLLHTVHERACLLVCRQMYTRLAQCLEGLGE